MKTTYQIDPMHSSAHFTVRHMMITNVHGTFGGVTGAVVYDADNPSETTVQATVDAKTLSTQDANRDVHVKGADFLDTEQFPSFSFVSTRVESSGSGVTKVAGDLTLRGVTRQVTLDVDGPTPEGKDPWGNLRSGASAAMKIKRSDFGLTWNAALETGGVVVGDDVKIDLDLSMIKS